MNINLESGRVIGLESLAQDKTYAGVLMGAPRTYFNNGIIDHFREKAAKKYSSGRVIVLEPVRTPRNETGRTPDDSNARARYGPVEYLPAIVCEGVFRSECLRRDSDYSLLVIIWWQPRFALPIEPGIVTQIAKVDWESSAWDYVD
jgi:hypothetical protein